MAADNRIQTLTREAESTTTFYGQAFQARGAEMSKLRELVHNSEMKVEDAEHERDGGRARPQQLQDGQLKLLSAVSRVQNEISPLIDGLEKDSDYLMKRQVCKFERMFIQLGKILSGKVMQSKNMIYEETKHTVEVFIDGWQKRLNMLCNLVATSLVAPSSLAEASLDGPRTTEPKASGGESGGYADSSSEYQFEVDAKSLPQ